MNGTPEIVSAARPQPSPAIGFVFVVPAQHRDDDLDFILEAIDEQRTDRTVDQARQQRLAFGRAAFALKKPPNAA
ncbi:MAG: hypothetical protein R3C30_02615 [Hyphomonadaceae bacterium]